MLSCFKLTHKVLFSADFDTNHIKQSLIRLKWISAFQIFLYLIVKFPTNVAFEHVVFFSMTSSIFHTIVIVIIKAFICVPYKCILLHLKKRNLDCFVNLFSTWAQECWHAGIPMNSYLPEINILWRNTFRGRKFKTTVIKTNAVSHHITMLEFYGIFWD